MNNSNLIPFIIVNAIFTKGKAKRLSYEPLGFPTFNPLFLLEIYGQIYHNPVERSGPT
jgi:hypothetical protein